MSKSGCNPQLDQFRRDAKRLARAESIPLHVAQDRIAATRGFGNWSQLARNAAHLIPAASRSPTDAPTRYYVHGDQSELDPSKYYCGDCEAFLPSSHFESVHGDRAVVAYVRTLMFWTNRRESSLFLYRRPDDAANVFTAEVQDRPPAHMARERSRSRFSQWLDAQSGREGLVGDLARASQRWKVFPVEAESLDLIEAFLRWKGKGDEVISAMRTAYAEYSFPGHPGWVPEPWLGFRSLWELSRKSAEDWEHFNSTGRWPT